MNSEIENIIVKFLTNSATGSELEVLSTWVKKSENLSVFKNYVETHYAINKISINSSKEGLIDKLLVPVKQNVSITSKFNFKAIYKFAALILLLVALTMTYFSINSVFNKSPLQAHSEVIKNIKPGFDKAVLTTANGDEVKLKKGVSYKTESIISDGEEIVYEPKDIKKNTVTYNYLTVPVGGQFSIKLSDGTKVRLNSKSKLKYPVQFFEGQKREVELVYGEAYFDVTKGQTEFIIKNQTANITVLGTKFNVSAYAEDDYFSSTLVEGSIKLSAKSTEAQSVYLRPGERGLITNSEVEVSTVDTSVFTSWIDGKFYFEKENLGNILAKMSRWYAIEVAFETEELKNKRFTGVASKNMAIEDLLNLISKSTNIDYKVIKKQEANLYELFIFHKL